MYRVCSMIFIVGVLVLTGCKHSKEVSASSTHRKKSRKQQELTTRVDNNLNSDTSEISIEEEYSLQSLSKFLREYVELKYQEHDNFDTYLFVSIKYQNMYLIEDDVVLKKYKISSAKRGVGNASGSERTPIGLHRVKKKIGHGVPLGGLFKSRQYTGEVATIYNDGTKSSSDDITTRIMWLEGMEHGVNKGKNIDSYKRYIYIHGTSEEGLIGTPQSHGCIRMKNKDVLELYSIIKEGTPVLIINY